MFGWFLARGDHLRGTPKGDPVPNEVLREQHPAIRPGYHTDKRHWNTLHLEEGLPDDLRLAEMKASGAALTRPELAVLTAYSKIELFNDVVASKAPDDPFFRRTLVRYFPEPLAFDLEFRTVE